MIYSSAALLPALVIRGLDDIMFCLICQVYLANGKKVTVNIGSTDQSEDVLETVSLYPALV